MNNISWAPIIGVLLVLVGIIGLAFNILASTDAFTVLTVGLGVLGIHSSNLQLAGKISGRTGRY